MNGPFGAAADVICLSHLRWHFVFQRPQHLMTRCAKERRVFYVEEPVFTPGATPALPIDRQGSVTVVTPQLPTGLTSTQIADAQRRYLDQLIAQEAIASYALWYYTPMALAFSEHLTPEAIVYDCMDELSAFKGAPPGLKDAEARLLARASLVLTGGQSLYEAKRHSHGNIHLFPSSVDVDHFAAARQISSDPDDQQVIPHPRLGFFGVIDERMDLPLLAQAADARPDWHFVMIGPVVKIDHDSLPRRSNIHYLGAKSYHQLPQYVAGWDVALLPFARNDATRFISPTKTPEYLAAGKPVVSTSIRDVVRPYGQRRLARIADDPADFVAACDAALAEDPAPRLARADAFLRDISWDHTWRRISTLLTTAIARADRGTDTSAAAAVAL